MFAEHYTTTVGAVEITVAPDADPPGNVDAVVEEQDTALLLGGVPVLRDTAESYSELVVAMQRQTPLAPGQVLVKHTTPRRFIAIIYAVDQHPPCRTAWINTALIGVLREIRTCQARQISMPLLGVAHGRLPAAEFMRLLCATLPAAKNYPEKIRLVTPLPEYRDVIRYLDNLRH